MTRTRLLIIIGVALAAATALWLILRTATIHEHVVPRPADDLQSSSAGASPARQDRRVLYWYDPMRPDVHFDKPGKSPFMDMQLVPKYADASAGAETIVIDPRMVQSLGVRTAPVTRGSVTAKVEAVGSVTVDETRIFAIESRASGWVERLDVRAVGEPVRRGQTVAGVYSADLYTAQAELVLAAKSGDGTLIAAARRRLGLLGMSSAQIDEVLRRGEAMRQVSIASPANGVVTELNVREGQQVAPAMPLMRIADLSRVWVTVELPESQLGSLQAGQKVTARLRALPGKEFPGEVQYVYPRLESATRTASARIVFENPQGELKPGMYAEVTLAARTDKRGETTVVLVPSEAVIRTGTRTVVIVAEANNRFRPARVEIGPESQGQTVILAGLEEGERVVVSGQFLIDSEASLQGALERLSGESRGEDP
jgi:Cu(I)/Ag(I) efflux system membrane fusion protein